jgi:hypothetical protein
MSRASRENMPWNKENQCKTCKKLGGACLRWLRIMCQDQIAGHWILAAETGSYFSFVRTDHINLAALCIRSNHKVQKSEKIQNIPYSHMSPSLQGWYHLLLFRSRSFRWTLDNRSSWSVCARLCEAQKKNIPSHNVIERVSQGSTRWSLAFCQRKRINGWLLRQYDMSNHQKRNVSTFHQRNGRWRAAASDASVATLCDKIINSNKQLPVSWYSTPTIQVQPAPSDATRRMDQKIHNSRSAWEVHYAEKETSSMSPNRAIAASGGLQPILWVWITFSQGSIFIRTRHKQYHHERGIGIRTIRLIARRRGIRRIWNHWHQPHEEMNETQSSSALPRGLYRHFWLKYLTVE